MRLSVIFITGAAILALQLIASRVMTPYFGVSLYIWTSILSITLLFLAIGYWVGGKLTQKIDSKSMALWFHSSSAISALWIVLSCLIYPQVFQPLALWDLIMGSFIACLLLLSLPLFILSALNPILVALTSNHIKDGDKATDSGSGHVFFVSTMGSVVGVLIAAFGIIPYTTNYQAMLWIAVTLSLTSLLAVRFEEHLKKGSKMLITFLAIIGLVLAGNLIINKDTVGYSRVSLAGGEHWSLLADIPSAFGTLKVIDWNYNKTVNHLSLSEQGQILRKEKTEEELTGLRHRRLLVQNGMVQNMIKREPDAQGRPQPLTFFSYVLESLALSLQPEAKTALVLGTGAGIMPGELRDRGLKVDVVEIDKATLYAAKKYFMFDDTDIGVFIEDARTFVKACSGRYDLVMVDLFHSTAGVPEHLVTQEFFSDIKNCLTPSGAIAVNFVMVKKHPETYYTFLATLNSVYGETFAFYRSERKGAVNAFVGARRDGDVKTVLADPVFLKEFGELVPRLDGSMIPIEMIFEFEKSLSTTKQIYTSESPDLVGYAPITDEKNNWFRLSSKAQIAHQSKLIKDIEPALLVN